MRKINEYTYLLLCVFEKEKYKGKMDKLMRKLKHFVKDIVLKISK